MKKSLFLTFITTLLVTACAQNGSVGETVTLKVWGPQQEQNFLYDATARFKTSFPQLNVEFEIASVSEVELKSFLTLDIPGGADVFSFMDDQLTSLVAAGALSKVQQFQQEVNNRNLAWTLEVASINDELYAYPYTADNGIYMFYDKRYITAEEMGSMDTILAKAESLSTRVNIDQMGGWGMNMWFLPQNDLAYNGVTQTMNWNQENGYIAAQAMLKYYANPVVMDTNNLIPTLFLENNRGDITKGLLAGVSGYWQAPSIQQILGEHMGTIKLPTYLNSRGETIQLGSLVGARLVGVNAFTRAPSIAHQFANWLTSETNQTIKANQLLIAPSNIASLNHPTVQAIGPIKALADQGQFGTPQATAVSSFYWIPADAFAKAIIAEARTIEAKVTTALNQAIQNGSVDPGDTLAISTFKNEEKERQLTLSYEKIPGWMSIFVTSVTAIN